MAWAFPVEAALSRPLVDSFRRTGYSRRRRGLHWATDIGARCGSKVRAPRNAKVIAVGNNIWGPDYGQQILLGWRDKTGRMRYLFMAHFQKVYVKPGQRVRKRQLLARVGDTGNSRGCHVHVEYGWSRRWDMRRWNPYKHLERARKLDLARQRT